MDIKTIIQEAWNDGNKDSRDKFGDFLDRAEKAVESEIQARLASMVDDEGILTEQAVAQIPDTEYLVEGDFEPGGGWNLYYEDYVPLLKAQHAIDKLHEEQAVKVERERIYFQLETILYYAARGNRLPEIEKFIESLKEK